MSNINDFVIEDNVLIKYVGNDETVIIPDTVIGILGRAFLSAKHVKCIYVPESVIGIEEGAFEGCSSLESITLPFVGEDSTIENDVPFGYIFGEGQKYRGGIRTVQRGRRDYEFYIPASLKCVRVMGGHLTPGAFDGCKNITQIIIENGPPSIRRWGFGNCLGLNELTLPESITYIADDAFLGCKNLTKLTVGNSFESWDWLRSLKSLDMLVVGDMSNMPVKFKPFAVKGFLEKYINGKANEDYIESYLTYIKHQRKALLIKLAEYLPLYIFMADKKILPVESIDDILLNVENLDIKALLLDYKNKEMAECIKGKFEKSEENQLEDSLIDKPLSVAELKKLWRLKRNEDLTYSITGYTGNSTDIVIPNQIGKIPVTAISDSAFSQKQITSVVMPETIIYIGKNAFNMCNQLEKVAIPKNVSFIGEGAFSECEKLKCIVVDEANENYESIGGHLYSKDAFLQYAIANTDVKYAFAKNVKKIMSKAFAGCKYLSEINFPDGLISINSCAFYNCINIDNIVLPESINDLGDQAFLACEKLKTITLPNGLQTIKFDMFRACYSLERVVVPDSVTIIEKGVFDFCKNVSIYTTKNSYVEAYAIENNIPIQYIED